MRVSAIPRQHRSESSTVLLAFGRPKAIIRYVFYTFVFSIPFEAVNIGLSDTLPRLIGFALLALAVVYESESFLRPPKAFWCFAIYILVYIVLGLDVIYYIPQGVQLAPEVIAQLKTQLQLLILLLISYNLMRSERVKKGALLALALSGIALAILQALGLTSSEMSQERMSAFGENPNALASVLSLGLLALVGLAYGRKEMDKKLQVVAWLGSLFLLVAIVRTGSRGDVLALIVSLFTLAIKPNSVWTNVKMALTVAVVVSSLAIASYQIDAVRERWESTYYEGDVAGRDDIFAAASEMFLERPVIGWGPVSHYYELGARLGKLTRDEHDAYLWLLLEVGLLGALPFFAGLWFCWRSAWKGRGNVQGAVPFAMLFYFIVVNIKGTWLLAKLFWLVIAYALAGGYVASFRESAYTPHARWLIEKSVTLLKLAKN